MHVMVIPADRGGCGYFRLVWPAQAVSSARPDWTVSIVGPERVKAGFVDGKFIGVRGMPDPLPDVVVMQRVGTAAQVETLRWLSARGVATVVDYDDAMWAIDKGNYAWRAWNVGGDRGQHWRTCDDAAVIADVVTVTTDSLARRYGRHGRVSVIPNRVPKAATLLERQGDHEVFTAGWSGYTRTHPKDLSVSRPAAHAVKEAGGRVMAITDPEGIAREWGLEPDLSLPPLPLGPTYFGALSNLDLMLVGLRDTPFNKAKSTLKVLEAGAAGVPSIAPDNPPHRALARSGFPVTLAASPAEWREAALRHARMGADERRALYGEVRLAVWQHHTIEDNAEDWAQAWERAMRRKHG